ncbi:MAG: RCC1 domain-containing protein, partial [Acidimicrobiales bacterium]
FGIFQVVFTWVQTIPTAPTGVVAFAGNGQAEVTWMPPANSGTSPIDSYGIIAYPTSGYYPVVVTINCGLFCDSGVVPGLANGVGWTFAVHAHNASGSGASGTTSAAITPSANPPPYPPTAATAWAGNGDAYVAWSAPPANGGTAVTGYVVAAYEPSAYIGDQFVAAGATSAVYGGLTNGQSYAFVVYSYNAAGTEATPSGSVTSYVTPSAAPLPFPVTSPIATAGDTTVEVAWSAPASGSAPPTTYVIQEFSFVNNAVAFVAQDIVSAPVSMASFSGLADGTTYVYGIYAGNANGYSQGVVTNFATPQSRTTTPLAGGAEHSLAVLSDGSVWAFGQNDFGQLGDGSTASSPGVRVSGLSNTVSVAAGAYHSLALLSGGTVSAWGWNGFGQLGDGATTNATTPVSVSGLSGISAIAAGTAHSLALRSDGTVWAWGDNTDGQLGDGTTTSVSTPAQVAGLTGVVAIAAGGNHSLALRSDGTVWAWGDNTDGQLGDGTTINRITPIQVFSSALSIGAGADHSLAVRGDGTVWDWGANSYGQLGDGTTTESTTPVQVSGLTGVTAVAGAEGHSLALRYDGTVWDWGLNADGELGDNTTTDSSVPVQVQGSDGIAAINVLAIAAGDFQSLASISGAPFVEWGLHPDGTICLTPMSESSPAPPEQPEPEPIVAPIGDPVSPPVDSFQQNPALSDAYDFAYPDGLNTVGEGQQQANTVTNPGLMTGQYHDGASASQAESQIPIDTYFFYTGHGGVQIPPQGVNPGYLSTATYPLNFFDGTSDSYMAATPGDCATAERQTGAPISCVVPVFSPRPDSLVVLSACYSDLAGNSKVSVAGAFYAQGATTVVGFTGCLSNNNGQSALWASTFWSSFRSGQTVTASVAAALTAVKAKNGGQGGGWGTADILGDGDLTYAFY